MTTAWITTASTNVEATVNSLNAACDRGFVPDELLDVDCRSPKIEPLLERDRTIIEGYEE